MIFTTPPEAAPICWCLGGPWHGRRIVRPGRTTAFEVALLVDGTPMIQTYLFVSTGAPTLIGIPGLNVEGWQMEAQADGWWAAGGLRRGLSQHDVRYLYGSDTHHLPKGGA